MDNIGSTLLNDTNFNVGNSVKTDQVDSITEPIASAPMETVSMSIDRLSSDVPSSLPVKMDDLLSNKNGSVNEHVKVAMNDDEHSDKPASCCSMLNKLFLGLAITSFVLFVCSITYILLNVKWLNGKYGEHKLEKIDRSHLCSDDFFSDQLISASYFNLTHPKNDHFVVTVHRVGASISDIWIPAKDGNGRSVSRSIVIKGGQLNSYGSVRFGFDDPRNSLNLTNQLPPNYPLLTYHRDEWAMYGDINKPYRVRFVRGLVQIIYEFSSIFPNEFVMTSMVATPSDQPIVADPTNNIYFNLRGHGNLSTHYLNISLSSPFNISHGQKVEQDRLVQAQRVDQLMNVNNYFYKMDRASIGKNHIATLYESETRTTMNIFSNHAGVIIDPFGTGYSDSSSHPAMTSPDMRGIRLSPRQSPIYQPVPLYGPTLITFPSQAIHTTWWQFPMDI